jgi:hypothetical protein
VRAGNVIRAWELKVDILNGIWERSQEHEAAGDAFFRRIRGKDLNPTRYLDPLTLDRGAALARIMQADKQALEVLLSGPRQTKGVRDRPDQRLRRHPRC